MPLRGLLMSDCRDGNDETRHSTWRQLRNSDHRPRHTQEIHSDLTCTASEVRGETLLGGLSGGSTSRTEPLVRVGETKHRTGKLNKSFGSSFDNKNKLMYRPMRQYAVLCSIDLIVSQ